MNYIKSFVKGNEEAAPSGAETVSCQMQLFLWFYIRYSRCKVMCLTESF